MCLCYNSNVIKLHSYESGGQLLSLCWPPFSFFFSIHGVIRHPMYSSTLILFLSMGGVLGSPISIAILLLYIPIIAKRIRNEEEILEKGLEGYTEYKKKVRYKVIPYIWWYGTIMLYYADKTDCFHNRSHHTLCYYTIFRLHRIWDWLQIGTATLCAIFRAKRARVSRMCFAAVLISRGNCRPTGTARLTR